MHRTGRTNFETLKEKRIRVKAEEIYKFNRRVGRHIILDRGTFRERTAQDDWLEAEREINQEIENQWVNQG